MRCCGLPWNAKSPVGVVFVFGLAGLACTSVTDVDSSGGGGSGGGAGTAGGPASGGAGRGGAPGQDGPWWGGAGGDPGAGGTGAGGTGAGGSGTTPGVDARPSDAAPPPNAVLAACPWTGSKAYQTASDMVYEPQQVVRFDLEIKANDLQALLTRDQEIFVPAAVSFCGVRLDGAGVRFRKSSLAIRRGLPFAPDPKNPKLFSKKNPILIDVNELVPASNQKLFGLRKINFEYGNDQLLIAERMNWELLRAFGLNVSRVNSANLYVNGEYWGLFTSTERVDRSFAAYHYGNDTGNLYKHQYCGTYSWLGSNQSAYKTECYALKTNELVADYSDLVHLVDVINNSKDLKTELPKVLNVTEWIKQAAALQSLAYGDSLATNGNNSYAYHSSNPDRFEFTPWDMDGGYWWPGQPCERMADTINRGLFAISKCFTSVPVFQKVVAVADWRVEFLRAARGFTDGPFSPAKFVASVDALVKFLGPHLATDPNRSGTDAQWKMQIDSLKVLQQRRYEAVNGQLKALGY